MGTPEEYYSAAPPPEPVSSSIADYFGPPPAPAPAGPPPSPAPAGPPPANAGLPDSIAAQLNSRTGGPSQGPAPLVDPVTRLPIWNPETSGKVLSVGKPPPPQLPSGATPEENAELARFEEGLKRKSAAARPATPGGPVVPVNPDPYGQKAAAERILGTYGDEAEARRVETANAQGKILADAQGAADLARQQQEDAAIANAERDQASQHFDQQMETINQQLDAVRQRKIDPLKGTGYGGSTLNSILTIIGGAMGGLYQGVNHLQSNPFIDDMNRAIDRNIAVQEKDIANAKEGLHDKLNLLGQQRAAFKDEQIAKLQTRNLYYEAAKQEIAAQAAPFQSGVIKAQGDQLIAQVTRAQAGVQKQLADAAQAKAQAMAAQSAAREKSVRDIYKDTYFELIKSGATPEQAELEARRMAGQLYGGVAPARPPSSGPGTTPLTKEGREKQQEAFTEVVGAHKSIYGFDPNKVAAGGAINAHWPNAINSSEGKAKNEERERYNSFVRQAVGSAWRLTTNGMEPKNQDVLEEQAEPFLAVPTDSAEDILRKQQNLGDHLSKAANAKGLSIPSGKPTVTLRNADGTPK